MTIESVWHRTSGSIFKIHSVTTAASVFGRRASGCRFLRLGDRETCTLRSPLGRETR